MVAWTGDNPSSLIGTGLIREGRVAISLGTSDTIFGAMDAPRVSDAGVGHVFGAPTGAFMGITVFKNGSLAREQVRDAYALDWDSFSLLLQTSPPGNQGALMLPWFEPEITPAVTRAGIHRDNLDPHDAHANVRAIIEAQMMAMARHSAWMGVRVDTIHATGGASRNTEILQVMADVFNARVERFQISNSAALGAALRAYQAHTGAPWPTRWSLDSSSRSRAARSSRSPRMSPSTTNSSEDTRSSNGRRWAQGPGPRPLSGPEQQLDDQLVEPLVSQRSCGQLCAIERARQERISGSPGIRAIEKARVRLRSLCVATDLSQQRLNLAVVLEPLGLLLQDQVGPHAAGGEVPHAFGVFGAVARARRSGADRRSRILPAASPGRTWP